MDVNQLLRNHQLAKLRAQHAMLPLCRSQNAALVGQYAERITHWRVDAGLSETGWPKDERSFGRLVS